MLAILKRDFPEKYASQVNQARVDGWVAEIDSGAGRDADQIRDDIVRVIIGKDDAMARYDITEEQFNNLVKGGNEGGINFGDIPPPQMTSEGQSLNNVPGTPEVWKVGSNVYLVYTVPGTEDDPVHMAWLVPSRDDLVAMFGPDQPVVYNRVVTDAEFQSQGVLTFGTTDEIPATEKDPFSTWEDEMAMQAQTQPWILDDDYQALMAMALVEGRALTTSEIQTTNWWKTHNAAQRQWMTLYHGDPQEAERYVEEARRNVESQIRDQGGGTNADPALVDFIATKVAQGDWTQAYATQQIKAATDPYSNYQVDEELAPLVAAHPLDQTNNEEDTVRSLLNTWLGPAFGNWSESEIQRWAGLLRNDPNKEGELVESLKDQRMALLPGYTDRNLSYQSIANTWRQFFIGQWGQNPDETSDLWLKVLKNNDTELSGQLLRQEGINQGVAKVVADLNKQSVANVGGSVRGAVYA